MIGDPALSWLGPLTGVVTRVDQLATAKEGDPDGSPEAIEAATAAARNLLAAPDETSPFGARYLTLLQREPDVVLAHAETTKALRGGGTDPDAAT